MGDSSSAYLFGEFFTKLAKRRITPTTKKIAAEVFKLTRGFDFTPDEMDCDKAAVKLGFAKMVPSEDYDPEYDDPKYAKVARFKGEDY